MLSSKEICKKYDLSSVRVLYTGAAPTGKETVEELLRLYPTWSICQGYGTESNRIPENIDWVLTRPGLTESATVVISTSEEDIFQGSSGSLLPGVRAKIMDQDGKEITEYGKPGELYLQSPSVTLGYLNNEKATTETFVWDEDGRWLRTGDEVIALKSPKGNEHFAVVDRLKELIKVKVRHHPDDGIPPLIPPQRLTQLRATKSPLPNWKPTSSPTPPSMTAL
jgi:acyl-CoA synthetase (AMP-forming)/AMP-acid ligase II